MPLFIDCYSVKSIQRIEEILLHQSWNLLEPDKLRRNN